MEIFAINSWVMFIHWTQVTTGFNNAWVAMYKQAVNYTNERHKLQQYDIIKVQKWLDREMENNRSNSTVKYLI